MTPASPSLALRSLALFSLALLPACWKRAPGPAALAAAEGPVATFEERVPANAVDLVLAVRAGSAHDPVGLEGLAWLTAHALREAGGPELEARLYALGTALRVEVGPELVTFHLRCREADAVACAEALGATVASPALNAAALDAARALARTRLAEQALGPAPRLADLVFDRWTYEGHPYGRLPAGRSGALDAITPADLVRFHQDRYLRPATALGVAGLATAEAVVDVQAALGGLPPRLYVDATPRMLPPVRGRRVLVVQAPVAEERVVLGHATELRPDHPDRLAIEAGLAILGRGPDSRIGRALRAGEGLDVEVDAALDDPSMRVQPAARVAMRPAPGQALPAVAVALGELRRLVDEGPTADELILWRAEAEGRTRAADATAPDRALAATVGHLLHAPPAAARLAAIQALDPETVRVALGRHLDPDNLRVVVLTSRPGDFDGLGIEGTDGSPVPGSDGAAASDYGVGISAVLRASSEEILR